jgi:peptide/nickel transport system substrate-binding protein
VSGQLDLVLDPSPQDTARLRKTPGVKLVEGPENRIVFIGLDQGRDQLLHSSVKGRNPFKDPRVRRALYQAIDIETIRNRLMRGQALPTGGITPSPLGAYNDPALESRLPFDLAAAKRGMTEAGYPQGFEVTLDCPNNRYINDEEICQAVTAMWAKVGVKAKLRTLPLVTYFPMIQRYEASIYMLGWGVPTFDAMYTLQSLVRTVGTDGDGNYNVGRYSNPRLDAVIDRAKVETDLLVRNRRLVEALQIAKDDVSHIPLHNQVIPWAMKKNIEVVHRPDNRIDWRLVKVN